MPENALPDRICTPSQLTIHRFCCIL